MRIVYTIMIMTMLFLSGMADAQSISGPTVVMQGEIATYSIDQDQYYINPSMVVVGGTFSGLNVNGTTYSIDVTWNTVGSGSVTFKSNNLQIAWLPVTVSVSCSTPATPSGVTFTLDPNMCGTRSVVRSGSSPPSGVTWYWQTSASGTNTSYPDATFTANTSGTYYVRAKSNTGTCWSPGAASVSVTVNALPSMPSTPTVSSTACGAKTLTRGSVPSGVTFYWQGTNSNGTDVSLSGSTYSATANGTYYIRARHNTTLCWSNSRSVAVTLGNPATPNAPAAFTFCEWENKPLTTSGYPSDGSLKWYNAAGTTLLYTGAVYSPTLTVGTYSYRVKSVNAGGCESLGYVTASVTVPSNCDQRINWNKMISYGIDSNGDPKPLSSSMEYSDGFGNLLQAQTKSYAQNQVLASQPVYDRFGNPSLSTLPAPINTTDFIYKNNFITNASGQRYSKADFDAGDGSVSGEVNNPKPVGNGGIGTLGWYYSTSNTLETKTPITQYPYTRSYTPQGPDPKTSKSAAAGDTYKMGLNRESVSERYKINAGELDHYFNIRPLLISTPNPYPSTNLLGGVSLQSTSGFTVDPASSATVTSSGGVITVTSNTGSGNPGVWPIGGNIPVTPGKVYTYRARGFRATGASVNVSLRITTTTGTEIVPGAVLPQGSANEDWATTSFTVPAGVTAIRVGIRWDQAFLNHSFSISKLELRRESPTSTIGYKYVSKDPDGKKTVSFVDANGQTLASALITSTSGTASNPVYTYDYWSYSYYNDMGQLLATVAPNGVNTASNAAPTFVTTYKYDHFGRMIETTSADEGTSQFVYSWDGKIRFSQNQEQRNATPKRFSYTNYDYTGRLVESGEYTCNGTNPLVFEPHSTTTPATYSVLNVVDKVLPQGTTIEDVTSANFAALLGLSAKGDSRCQDFTYILYDIRGTQFTSDALHQPQENLFGRVSKTENGISKTFYNYDEFGQLTWTKQSINGWGWKTIDYTYDYLGNVTQVAYQKTVPGQPVNADEFYHHYTYDDDQNLIQVHTSKDGTTKTLHAKYFYYLHGPLKRAELATDKQGIDYTYTINGSLKTINNGVPANDPGLDGISGANVSFMKDAFGETLQYHDGDYTGASYNMGTVTLNGGTYPNAFGGNIRAATYHNATDLAVGGAGNATRIYGYQYDSRNQLTNAQWGSVSGTTPTFTEAQRENVTSYDKNGNIGALVRKGKSAQTTANYSYVYEANSNKLDRVDHNSQTMTDFTYNSTGQLTQQVEGSKTFRIYYNAYGLVKEVRNQNSQYLITYYYDDRGDLVKKINWDGAGTAVNTLYYVNDASGNPMAIYSQEYAGAIQLIELPVYGAGRIATYKPAPQTFFYEVTDHLGNVRALIGVPKTDSYTATMESETAEEIPNKPFRNVAATRFNHILANHTPNSSGVTGNEVSRLNSAKPAGPAYMMAVSPGDVINVNAWAYYDAGSNFNTLISEATMLNAVAGAFGGVSGGAGEAGNIFNNVQSGFAGSFGTTANNSLPAAFITCMVYDKNYVRQFWSSAAVTASGSGAQENVVMAPIKIEQPGYVYICVYNRSQNATVYFDDFTISTTHSPILAGSDFYPFGLTMDGSEITDEKYRYGYQGQYSEENETTGWNEFELRMYDARFGRWISPDPYGQYASPYVGMGNIPSLSTDPNGGWSWITAGVGFVGGAAIGYGATGDWKGTLMGGVAGGLIGGAAFNQTRLPFNSLSNYSITPSSFGSVIGNTFSRMGKFFGKNPGVLHGVAQSFLSIDKNQLMAGGACCPGPCCPLMLETISVLSESPVAAAVVTRTAARTAVGWGGSLVEPTPIGEFVMTGVTIVVTAWTINEVLTELNNVHNVPYVVEMTARQWIEKYCKGSIYREFPEQFLDWTLEEIEKLAKTGNAAARKALKLLKEGRFRK